MRKETLINILLQVSELKIDVETAEKKILQLFMKDIENNNKIVKQFAIKYNLRFLNWIDYNVADFIQYVFTIDEMKDALTNNKTFENVLLDQFNRIKNKMAW